MWWWYNASKSNASWKIHVHLKFKALLLFSWTKNREVSTCFYLCNVTLFHSDTLIPYYTHFKPLNLCFRLSSDDHVVQRVSKYNSQPIPKHLEVSAYFWWRIRITPAIHHQNSRNLRFVYWAWALYEHYTLYLFIYFNFPKINFP